jgi:hypothetical protein
VPGILGRLVAAVDEQGNRCGPLQTASISGKCCLWQLLQEVRVVRGYGVSGLAGMQHTC